MTIGGDVSEQEVIGGLPTVDELESLFVNNEMLARIEGHLNRFNPINVMKMASMEIRHSAILAWLLDPHETHGLSDKFLKAFLGEAFRGFRVKDGPGALDISQADLRDVEVRCEWQNIDIFVFCPSQKWAFIVENKFYSKQHNDQLVRYWEKVESTYKQQISDLKISGVYLSLQEEDIDNPNYAVIKYATLCEFMPQMIVREEQYLATEVKIFLNHYLDILRDATGMSTEQTEMEKLARELYREHKKVLDFIVEHGAGSDFSFAARTLFGERTQQFDAVTINDRQYIFNGINNSQVGFLPAAWRAAFDAHNDTWHGCETWWMGYPLICWMQLWPNADGIKGTVRLYAELGPLADYALRTRLIAGIREVASAQGFEKNISFQRGAADEGRMYSKFFKGNSAAVDDIQDAEKISAALEALLKKFDPTFNAIAPAISAVLNNHDDQS